MPTSAPETIPAMIRYMRQANPRTILDVGSGAGKYGMLAREYLEIWQDRFYPNQWIIQIDGIEIWEPYKDFPAYQAYYDRFINADISDYAEDMPGYDLIICGDVLEHLEKSQAWKTFEKLLDHCRYLLLSLPIGFWPTSNIGDNIYESHISTWDDSDIELLPIKEKIFVQVPNRILVALLRGRW